jgi:hypothetical protein
MRFVVFTTLVTTIALALGVSGIPIGPHCMRSESGILDPRCSCNKWGLCD